MKEENFLNNGHHFFCREEEDLLHKQRILACTPDVYQSILSEVLSEEAQGMSREIYQIDVVQKLQELEDSTEAARLLVKARWLAHWCQAYAGRQRVKR